MNEDSTELLEMLAEKLGTTVEHLWEVLLRQAPISGTIHFVFALAIAVALWRLFAFVKRKSARPEKTEGGRHPSAEWDSEEVLVAWLVFAGLGTIGVLLFCVALSTAITCALNPEYWALMELLP